MMKAFMPASILDQPDKEPPEQQHPGGITRRSLTGEPGNTRETKFPQRRRILSPPKEQEE
jgi:hypothetical protein